MRLTHPTIRPVGRPIAFQFNNRRIEALQGETIAAALSAAEITTFRHTPSGAPRGLFCGMGACFDCIITIDGRIGQRACLTSATDGMQVQGGFPTALATDPTATPEDRDCDILVIGAGVSGLSAALSAAQSGAKVMVLDERKATGGQFAKPLAPSHHDTAPDPQFQRGLDLRAQAKQAGAHLETDAAVWGAFAFDEIAAIVRGRSITYHPRRLILATGAHEAPVPIPGWTLPGVMTTGGLQTLVRTQRVSPGTRILIAGNGPLNLQLACELVASGIKPIAVLEAASRPTATAWKDLATMLRSAPDLVRDGWSMLRRLKRAGVPVLWNTTLNRLEGANRVQSAIAGSHHFDIDTVALNMGFQPEVNLARALGVPHHSVAQGVGYLATEADTEGRTPIPGIFAIGDGAILGGARVAQAKGHLAGLAAANELGFRRTPDTRTRAALAQAEAFQAALWRIYAAPPIPIADDAVVCRCEEITAARLRTEIAAGLASVPALKKATRAGMGRCQGRFCAATIARLCPTAPEPDHFAAPRAPLRPVPAAPLMREAPEFTAPLLTNPVPPTRLHALPPLAAETRHADIAVIGGGVAGLSTAYYLARAGADVLLIDRDEAAMAASTANAGSLHVQLLSYDFNDDTPPDGGPAAHTLPLGPRSIALWKQIASAAGEDLGLRTNGGLMLAEDDAAMAWLRRKSAMEQSCGIESHILGSNELRTLAPALSDRMLGADFVPAEGYGDPLRGMMALLRLAQAHGARIPPGRRGPGDRAFRRLLEHYHQQRHPIRRPPRQRHRSLGRSDRPHDRPRLACDRHCAAGDRHRTGTTPDQPSRGRRQPPFVAETTGQRWLSDRRRLVRRLQPNHRSHQHPAPQHRGQSMGLRTSPARGEIAVHPARLDRHQSRDRSCPTAGSGTRTPRLLQYRHRKRLHTGTCRWTNHRRGNPAQQINRSALPTDPLPLNNRSNHRNEVDRIGAGRSDRKSNGG